MKWTTTCGWLLMAVAALLCVTACRSDETADVEQDLPIRQIWLVDHSWKEAVYMDQDLPTLRELEARTAKAGDPYPAKVSDVRLRVHQVRLPRDKPLDRVWALLSSDGLSDEMVELWRRNGLRVGTISSGQYASLRDAVGATRGVTTGEYLSSRQYLPLRLTTRWLRDAVHVRLVQKVDGQEEAEWLERGTMQWLLRFSAAFGGMTLVELTPHLYQPANPFEAMPESAFESMLEGRVFEPLRLAARLREDQLLVVGVVQNAKPPFGSEPQGRRQAAESAEAAVLGELLMTGERKKSAYQVLLVIGTVSTRRQTADRAEVDREIQEVIRLQRKRESQP